MVHYTPPNPPRSTGLLTSPPALRPLQLLGECVPGERKKNTINGSGRWRKRQGLRSMGRGVAINTNPTPLAPNL